mgnify:CR=1 FL=1
MKGFFAFGFVFGIVSLLLLAPALSAQSISSCDTLITENAVLTNDILLNSTNYEYCLSFAANNVTLDCHWNAIIGNGSYASDGYVYLGYPFVGVNAAGVKNVTIKNCRILGTYTGIVLDSTNDSVVFGNVLDRNWFGVHLRESSNNFVSSNSMTGALVGINVRIGVFGN